MRQKESFVVNGIELKTATQFDTNYRERQPVIAQVVNDNDVLDKDDIIICHHNLFYHKSPYYLYANLFSIPANKVIFAKLNIEDASLFPVYGNFLCNRVNIETLLTVPTPKQHLDRVVVTHKGNTKYMEGQLLFTTPYAYYEMVYIVNGEEYRTHKCHESSVCGVLIEDMA
jgi:hypothetical protein